eukprot:g65664.t1
MARKSVPPLSSYGMPALLAQCRLTAPSSVPTDRGSETTAARRAILTPRYVLRVETPAPLSLNLEPANEAKVWQACHDRARELKELKLSLEVHADNLQRECSGQAEARARLDRQLQQLRELEDQYKVYGRWLQERRLNQHQVEFEEVLRQIRPAPEGDSREELYSRLTLLVTQEALGDDELLGTHLRQLHELLLAGLRSDVDLRNEVQAKLRPALHEKYTWQALMKFGTASRVLDAVFGTWQAGSSEYLAWALARGGDPNFRVEDGGCSVLDIALNQFVESKRTSSEGRERVVVSLVSSSQIADNTVGEGLVSLLRCLFGSPDDERVIARRRCRRHCLIEVMLRSRKACEHIKAFDLNPDGGLLEGVYWRPPANQRVLDPHEVHLLFCFLFDHHDNLAQPGRLRLPSENAERQRLASDLRNATRSTWYKENQRFQYRVNSYLRELPNCLTKKFADYGTIVVAQQEIGLLEARDLSHASSPAPRAAGTSGPTAGGDPKDSHQGPQAVGQGQQRRL